MDGDFLVERDGGVDGAGPVVDASGEGLDVGKVLPAQPHGDGERSLTVVAEDDDGLVGIEFGIGAGGNIAHRHEDRIGEACGAELPGLTDVEDKRWVGLGAELEEGLGGYLWVKHT